WSAGGCSTSGMEFCAIAVLAPKATIPPSTSPPTALASAPVPKLIEFSLQIVDTGGHAGGTPTHADYHRRGHRSRRPAPTSPYWRVSWCGTAHRTTSRPGRRTCGHRDQTHPPRDPRAADAQFRHPRVLRPDRIVDTGGHAGGTPTHADYHRRGHRSRRPAPTSPYWRVSWCGTAHRTTSRPGRRTCGHRDQTHPPRDPRAADAQFRHPRVLRTGIPIGLHGPAR